MRTDLRVDNESDALVMASAALRGSGIGPGDAGWDAAVAAQRVFAVWLESEDPAWVRVVVAEPLQAEEDAQWVGVVRAALHLPDGRLALCGGIAWILDGGRWTEAFARLLEVPAGRYRADLYCYASAPNGRWCAQQVDPREPLGAWFRRTRPDEALPVWLHNRCVDDPTLDPGQALRWRRAQELPGGEVIDFVLHLSPLPVGEAVLPAGDGPEEGVLEPGECRRPQSFPLGLPLAGRALVRAQPAAPVPSTGPGPKWGVQALAQRHASQPLQPVAGGPVALPLAALEHVARLAWWCQPYAHPGLRIVHAKKPPRWRELEDVELSADGQEWRIGLRWREQPADAQVPLAALAKQLGQLADGSAIELWCARPGHAAAAGAQHWQGEVRGGQWQLAQAWPPVDATTLAEALALAQAAEGGRRLQARDEDEARRIEARVQRALGDCMGSNALLREGAELSLRRRDKLLFERIAARVFWMRYPDVWPLVDEDAVSCA